MHVVLIFTLALFGGEGHLLVNWSGYDYHYSSASYNSRLSCHRAHDDDELRANHLSPDSSLSDVWWLSICTLTMLVDKHLSHLCRGPYIYEIVVLKEHLSLHSFVRSWTLSYGAWTKLTSLCKKCVRIRILMVVALNHNSYFAVAPFLVKAFWQWICEFC